MNATAGKYRDRNPDIRAAGKLIQLKGSAKECISPTDSGRKTPDVVKKFQGTKSLSRPGPGQERIFHARAGDANEASTKTHGISTKPSLSAGGLANPPSQTLFNELRQEKKESLYASKQRAPLGRSHDQTGGLPTGLNPLETSFGQPTIIDGSAAEMVNPNKTRTEIDLESTQGQNLYKKSHNSFEVGEMVDREYNWTKVNKGSSFGVPTPHDNDGIDVKKSLQWLHETEMQKGDKLVSKRVDTFREKTQPQLGRVHDPIKDTLKVGKNHVYGIKAKPDPYGAGDLLHQRDKQNFLRGKDRQRGAIAAVRHHLKRANFANFSNLGAAFCHYDKDDSGKIDADELRQVCVQFKLPVDDEMIRLVMDWCDADGDGQIDYDEFVSFLNWHQPIPSPPGRPGFTRQIDKSGNDYKTSSQTINAVVGGGITQEFRTHGVPTIRSDLPAPRIRRLDDRKSYGDESSAYGLVNPSVYSNHGVYEEDFFQRRSPSEIKTVLTGIGVDMTEDVFQELWRRAAQLDVNGAVSVESFRTIMDEAEYQQQPETIS
ncbi:EF-hand domain-containing family member B-like [Oscarella lobularis]|uniref:EF-hand domain-containing family member B-like n=1 Tax=Oscarella lobularis TaxID=121494 RepID=UPI003313D1CC